MQQNIFIGNLAKVATVTGTGDRAVARFTLISNEYAGRD
ncbi:MAG: single-stranded DNA-binding protein, partial [Methylomicrobium sp.]|nr:single-stranded DNA-binding protein [Methylomicrobium sp.]